MGTDQSGTQVTQTQMYQQQQQQPQFYQQQQPRQAYNSYNMGTYAAPMTNANANTNQQQWYQQQNQMMMQQYRQQNNVMMTHGYHSGMKQDQQSVYGIQPATQHQQQQHQHQQQDQQHLIACKSVYNVAPAVIVPKETSVANEEEESSEVEDEEDVEAKAKPKASGKGGGKKKKATSKASKKKESECKIDLSKYDDENVREVVVRLKKGCDCQDSHCLKDLDPESVNRHRLNVEELTKSEHDMYLMGVTMACLENPEETNRHKERKRLRAKYRYKGKEVCLNAFLYLENTTLHQLKCIRKHLIDHGVTPRIHGNHRKKPHNTFSLDIYQHATRFLQAYFDEHCIKASLGKKKGLILLPATMSCKKIHTEYKSFGQLSKPGNKIMGYSTFRHFLKEQFPNLRFHKDDIKTTATTTDA